MTPIRDYFISHKKPIALVLFLVIMGGLFAYSKLQTSLFPRYYLFQNQDHCR
jgi:multidrug efflux pump subunit AcrB